MIDTPEDTPPPLYASHSRDWRRNRYVYPVISRRSHGLSIGVNLSPNASCNFQCIYCQVDRSRVSKVGSVDLGELGKELGRMIDDAQRGALFADPAFADVPPALQRINDIAFSGNGEPTACNRFLQCVEFAATLKRAAGLDKTKIVLITNACYLTRPPVVAALAIMDENNGEVWAKLDAGTEAHFQRVNRPNFTLRHVIDNIIAAARVRPVVIQSLFMRLSGRPAGEAELAAFVERLREILQAGGRISYVQVYTIARRPAEECVAPLTRSEVDHIVDMVRQGTNLPTEPFYSPGD